MSERRKVMNVHEKIIEIIKERSLNLAIRLGKAKIYSFSTSAALAYINEMERCMSECSEVRDYFLKLKNTVSSLTEKDFPLVQICDVETEIDDELIPSVFRVEYEETELKQVIGYFTLNDKNEPTFIFEETPRYRIRFINIMNSDEAYEYTPELPQGIYGGTEFDIITDAVENYDLINDLGASSLWPYHISYLSYDVNADHNLIIAPYLDKAKIYEKLKIFKCKECNTMFYMSESEMSWFIAKGLSLPKRCPTCRTKKKYKK